MQVWTVKYCLIILQVRQVCIERDKPGGLGLSVKGGAEHNLPVLVSRIFKDQAGMSDRQLSSYTQSINQSLSNPAVQYNNPVGRGKRDKWAGQKGSMIAALKTALKT